MKLSKPVGIVTFVISLVACLSASAYATANSSSRPQGFKMAIIEDAKGSNSLIQGKYHQAIGSLKSRTASYDKSFGLCAAKLKLKHFNEAKEHCSQAINLLQEAPSNNTRIKYLTAVAYSNRAIVNHFTGNHAAALDDMTSGLLIDNNAIVKHNLVYLKDKYKNLNNKSLNLQTAMTNAE